MDSLKSKRELKEKRKNQQELNVKKKELKKAGLTDEDIKAGKKPPKKTGEDEYVSGDEVEGAEVDEGVVDGAKASKEKRRS